MKVLSHLKPTDWKEFSSQEQGQCAALLCSQSQTANGEPEKSRKLDQGTGHKKMGSYFSWQPEPRGERSTAMLPQVEKATHNNSHSWWLNCGSKMPEDTRHLISSGPNEWHHCKGWKRPMKREKPYKWSLLPRQTSPPEIF